jgi:hypothetical protein
MILVSDRDPMACKSERASNHDRSTKNRSAERAHLRTWHSPSNVNDALLKSLRANRETLYLFPPSKKTLVLSDKVKDNLEPYDADYRGNT